MRRTCLCLILAAVLPLAAAQVQWTEDVERATAAAQDRGKGVLLLFTGSDWCHWCQVLEQEVFSQPAFAKWAAGNFALVKLDFPKRSQQAAEVAQRNRALAQEYGIKGYPTVVILGPDGKELARTGYIRGGADAWVADTTAKIKQGQSGKP